MRIGVFGGTFDPPHVGHLIVAQDACTLLELDRLLFVPAATPPHKRDRPVTPPPVRVELLLAAIEGDDRFSISEIELRRNGPSYTVDTLRELHDTGPAAEICFLLGVDQFRQIETWREPEEVARLATLVVLSRGEPDIAALPAVPHRRLEVTRVDVSSTAVRDRVRSGQPIRYLVPAAVETLIRARGLYAR